MSRITRDKVRFLHRWHVWPLQTLQTHLCAPFTQLHVLCFLDLLVR